MRGGDAEIALSSLLFLISGGAVSSGSWDRANAGGAGISIAGARAGGELSSAVYPRSHPAGTTGHELSAALSFFISTAWPAANGFGCPGGSKLNVT